MYLLLYQIFLNNGNNIYYHAFERYASPTAQSLVTHDQDRQWQRSLRVVEYSSLTIRPCQLAYHSKSYNIIQDKLINTVTDSVFIKYSAISLIVEISILFAFMCLTRICRCSDSVLFLV